MSASSSSNIPEPTENSQQFSSLVALYFANSTFCSLAQNGCVLYPGTHLYSSTSGGGQ